MALSRQALGFLTFIIIVGGLGGGMYYRLRPDPEETESNASSQEIASNSPLPRGPVRLSGCESRAGDRCCMMPEEPLAQRTPRLTG